MPAAQSDQVGPGVATATEHQSFRAANEMMRKGWTGTPDQLAGYLAQP
jgi:hypothetical protein